MVHMIDQLTIRVATWRSPVITVKLPDDTALGRPQPGPLLNMIRAVACRVGLALPGLL